MPAVLSCIMPVYNAEPYLKQSIESVLSQNFAWFELILVNDGSTDRSEEICQEFTRRDERVVLINQTNKGAAAARNAGLRAAQGRYITFVDADDILRPKAFFTTVQAMENKQLDLVSFNFDFCDGDQVTPAHQDGFQANSREELFAHFLSYYQNNQFFSLCNKVYRADFIRTWDLMLDETLRTSEDIQFNCRYFSHLEKMEHLDASFYEYHHHPLTLTRTASLDNMQTSQRALHMILNLLKEWGQQELYPQLAAGQLAWDSANFFTLLTDSSKPYTAQQRRQGLEQLFSNEIWHTALMTQLRTQKGFYYRYLTFAAQRRSVFLALLPLRVKGKC